MATHWLRQVGGIQLQIWTGNNYFMHVLTGLSTAAIDHPHLEALVALGLPVVLIGSFPYLPDAVSVGIDDLAASEQITAHLLDTHGRTNLVYVSGPLHHQAGLDRRDGFVRALTRRGLDPLASGPGFDGLVFADDDMAFGGLQVLKTAGRSVPDQVAVAGFDDFGLARLTTTGITTVRVPAQEMARLATERLFALVEGSPVTPNRRQLPVTLTIRQSCGCRKAGFRCAAHNQRRLSGRAGRRARPERPGATG